MAQEGVEQPKPLVPVCGEPMIERLLRIFVDCGATEIVVIVNEWSTAVREHLLPRLSLITPNGPELEALTGIPASSPELVRAGAAAPRARAAGRWRSVSPAVSVCLVVFLS